VVAIRWALADGRLILPEPQYFPPPAPSGKLQALSRPSPWRQTARPASFGPFAAKALPCLAAKQPLPQEHDMKKIIAAAAIAALTVAIQADVSAQDQVQAFGHDDHRRPNIEGVWSKVVTLRNCVTGEVAPVPNPIFPAINTFHAGGTMSEHGARFSPATRNSGQGIWKRIGRRSFATRTLWQNFDANGFFSGTFDVRTTQVLSPDGNSSDTTASFTITDPNGVVLVRGCATEVGQRVEL
jgi:hypothetical protein